MLQPDHFITILTWSTFEYIREKFGSLFTGANHNKGWAGPWCEASWRRRGIHWIMISRIAAAHLIFWETSTQDAFQEYRLLISPLPPPVEEEKTEAVENGTKNTKSTKAPVKKFDNRFLIRFLFSFRINYFQLILCCLFSFLYISNSFLFFKICFIRYLYSGGKIYFSECSLYSNLGGRQA